ncbi:hypothetical protein TGVEG_203470 [Toxoplasma gondii VEG]|uniref:Uncharacterized protein n=2 Tax=Toxoplasma gondii TaxID=5811 RepID=B9QFM5_TOXGV|nr:hypothetical protein TGVEG_203470 [Toxoplasma gondii VEG]KFG46179.1 hypothetical protein TGP89_203470 [Toxoplasma gondii p89]
MKKIPLGGDNEARSSETFLFTFQTLASSTEKIPVSTCGAEIRFFPGRDACALCRLPEPWREEGGSPPALAARLASSSCSRFSPVSLNSFAKSGDCLAQLRPPTHAAEKRTAGGSFVEVLRAEKTFEKKSRESRGENTREKRQVDEQSKQGRPSGRACGRGSQLETRFLFFPGDENDNFWTKSAKSSFLRRS